MSFANMPRRFRVLVLAVAATAAIGAPALAQQPTPVSAPMVTLAGGIHLMNSHMFRGIRQNATEVAMRPFVEVGVTADHGDGLVTHLGVHAGVWNNLHTGDTGSAGPAGSMRYENDYYASVSIGLAERLTLATSFTAYTSPNEMFTTVKELSLTVALDDRARFSGLNPYALIAVELATARGIGQADGGAHAGRYFEAGVSPEVGHARIALAFPVRLGMSAADYYELAGDDHRFGFVSGGAFATLAIIGTRDGRGLSIHAGMTSHLLGETTRTFNGGSRSKTTGTVGFRVSY
jgi:hypothetical protein